MRFRPALTLGLLTAMVLPATAAEFKALFIVFTRAEIMGAGVPGEQFRYYVQEADIAQIRSEIGLFEAEVEKANPGLDLSVQIKLAEDPMRFWSMPNWTSGGDLMRAYTLSAFNQAPFESEDKTFRGPYSGVFLIDARPGNVSDAKRLGATERVFDTPVSHLSWIARGGRSGAGALANDLLGAFASLSSVRQATGSVEWSPSKVLSETQTAGIFTEPKLAEDGLLDITVQSSPREGFHDLATGLNIDLSKTPILKMQVQVPMMDPFVIRLSPTQAITVNPIETPFKDAPAYPDGPKIRIEPSQTPRTIEVALKPELISGVRIEIPAAARFAEIFAPGPRKYRFGKPEFIASATDPTPAWALAPSQILMREMATADATKAASMLSNEDRRVVTSALERLASMSEPLPVSAFPRLKELARNADTGTAGMAIRCLGRLMTPEAKEALRYAIQVGPFEHCRYAASEVVLTTGDAELMNTLAAILTASEWPTRWMAVRALGKGTTREAAIIQISFLADPNAMVRTAVVENAIISNELVNRRLLFAAVNDPVESVRLGAYTRLLQTTYKDYLTEALKGVRDESLYVRVSLLKTLGNLGKPEFRSAVLVGLIDTEPRGRLAALEALRAWPDKVKRSEIEPLLSDPDESVRNAAQALLTAPK